MQPLNSISANLINSVSSQDEQQSNSLLPLNNVILHIPMIGISIINSSSSAITQKPIISRNELIYLSIIQFHGMISQYQTYKTIQVKIQDLQIDNQLKYRVPYPVLLQSIDNKKLIKIDPTLNCIFELGIVQKINVENISYYETIQAKLMPLELKLDDEIINYLYNFYKFILEEFGSTISYIDPIFLSKNFATDLLRQREGSHYKKGNNGGRQLLEEEKEEKKESPLKKKLLSLSADVEQEVELSKPETNEASKIYIGKLCLPDIILRLSFVIKLNAQSGALLQQQFNPILKALGVALANIDESTLKLKKVNLTQVFGNLSDVLDIIKNKYTMHFKRDILKLIGSIDFLGNPVKLVSTVYSGLHDFVCLPFQRGFFKGLYEGTLSLGKKHNKSYILFHKRNIIIMVQRAAMGNT